MAQQSLAHQTSLTTPRAAPSMLDDLFAYAAYGTLGIALLFATFDKSIAGLKPGEIALIGLVGLVGLRRVARRDFSFVTTPLDAAFLLLIAFGTFLPLVTLEVRGIFITKDIFRALVGPVEYYLWYRVFLEAVPLPSRLAEATRAILVLIAAVGLIGVLQFIHFPKVEPLLLNYYAGFNVNLTQVVNRATSVVGSWETLAAIGVYGLILINQVQTQPASVAKLGRYWNVILIGMALVCAGAVVTSLSFAGLVGTALGYGLAWWLNRRLPRVTLLTLGAGVLGLLAATPYLLARLHAGGNTGLILASWQSRFQHWQILYLAISKNLSTIVFGVQPGFTYPVITFNSTESMYWLLWYRGGLLYLLAFGVFMALVFRTILQARRASGGFEREILTGILTIFMVHFVIDIVDAHLFDAGESQLLLTLLAIAGGLALRTDRLAARAGRAGAPQGASALTRGALAVTALAAIGASGLAWNYNRHQPLPPATLTINTYDPYGATWNENQQIGTDAWMIDPGADTTFLQGYAGQISVLPGQSVTLYVSAPRAVTFDYAVYRLGWYRGQGGRLLAAATGLRSQAQGVWTAAGGLQGCATCASDPQTHLLDANWAPTTTLTIGADWLTGVYLIKLSSTDGVNAESYIPLVVRSNQPATAVIASVPVLSYAADNIWGGYSLDTHGTSDAGLTDPISPDRATQVSFNRPFVNDAGAGDLLSFALHTVRWMERSALPVDYTTDVDLAAANTALTGHRIFVELGPEPYWTAAMRQTWQTSASLTYAQGGTSLEFLGANDGYWQARLAPDAAGNANRTLVCYKVATNPPDPSQALANDPLARSHPALVTARWRDPALNMPENALLGIMYGGPLAAGAQPAWTAATGALDSIETQATGIAPGTQLKPGLIQFGYATTFDNGAAPAGLTSLALTPVTDAAGQPHTAVSAFYRTPNELVFDAGTPTWSWGLDEFTFPGATTPNTVLGEQHVGYLTQNLVFSELPGVTQAPG